MSFSLSDVSVWGHSRSMLWFNTWKSKVTPGQDRGLVPVFCFTEPVSVVDTWRFVKNFSAQLQFDLFTQTLKLHKEKQSNKLTELHLPESGAGAQSHSGLRESSNAAVVKTVGLQTTHTHTHTHVTGGNPSRDSLRTGRGAFTDSPQGRLSQTLRSRWAGSRRRWVVWATGYCTETHIRLCVRVWFWT